MLKKNPIKLLILQYIDGYHNFFILVSARADRSKTFNDANNILITNGNCNDQEAYQGAGGAWPALRGVRSVRRGGGSQIRALSHAGRQSCRLARHQTHLPGTHEKYDRWFYSISILCFERNVSYLNR